MRHQVFDVPAQVEAEVQEYRAAVCEQYGELWQFNLVRKASLWTLVAGGVLPLVVAAVGAGAAVGGAAEEAAALAGAP